MARAGRRGGARDARVEAGEFIVGSYVLIPTGKHRFFSVQDYMDVRADVGEDGKVTAMVWGTMRMRRVGGLGRN